MLARLHNGSFANQRERVIRDLPDPVSRLSVMIHDETHLMHVVVYMHPCLYQATTTICNYPCNFLRLPRTLWLCISVRLNGRAPAYLAEYCRQAGTRRPGMRSAGILRRSTFRGQELHYDRSFAVAGPRI